VVETCPVLILSLEDAKATQATLLDSYTYSWPDPSDPKRRTQAIVLGLGSLFNHSERDQNVGWTRSIEHQTLTYIALRDIDPDQELCINYGKVWFKDSDGLSSDSEDDGDSVLSRISDPL